MGRQTANSSSGVFFAILRGRWSGSQVVRRGSAKPLHAGSIPARTSKIQPQYIAQYYATSMPQLLKTVAFLTLIFVMGSTTYAFQIPENMRMKNIREHRKVQRIEYPRSGGVVEANDSLKSLTTGRAGSMRRAPKRG